ncbi:unknown [Clostridium sp. CAG:138]|nr:unknown [Clostridium sp. CAG:138]
MAACFQQRFIQIMSNIDSADKDISVFVKAKQRCVRNVSVRIPFLYFKVFKIIIKIVKIIAEYCIGGRICAVVFNIRFPFGQHFKQLFAVLRREPNKFNIHN